MATDTATPTMDTGSPRGSDMNDTPGWYDNAERAYLGTLKFLMKFRVLVTLGFIALLLIVGYEREWPLAEDAVRLVVQLFQAIPGV